MYVKFWLLIAGDKQMLSSLDEVQKPSRGAELCSALANQTETKPLTRRDRAKFSDRSSLSASETPAVGRAQAT